MSGKIKVLSFITFGTRNGRRDHGCRNRLLLRAKHRRRRQILLLRQIGRFRPKPPARPSCRRLLPRNTEYQAGYPVPEGSNAFVPRNPIAVGRFDKLRIWVDGFVFSADEHAFGDFCLER